MAFETKTWEDRISEYPNRRQLTYEDGTTALVTVARSEGTISTAGDPFSAAEMNSLETRIAAATLTFAYKVVATTDWVSDPTYSDYGYGYRASISCTGVDTNYSADVRFGMTEANGGVFSPITYTERGVVYIYASETPSSSITIPAIICTAVY